METKLKNNLRAIFNKYDPMGIYSGKNVNFDEYDPEIEQLPLIFDKKLTLKEFEDRLYKLFQRMFFPEIDKTKLKKLAKESYILLKQLLLRVVF